MPDVKELKANAAELRRTLATIDKLTGGTAERERDLERKRTERAVAKNVVIPPPWITDWLMSNGYASLKQVREGTEPGALSGPPRLSSGPTIPRPSVPLQATDKPRRAKSDCGRVHKERSGTSSAPVGTRNAVLSNGHKPILGGHRMPYCIIETEDGWTTAEMSPNRTAEEVAASLGAALIDPGPYDSYEEANAAIVSLQDELAEENGSSDLPGTQALEGREAD